LGISKLSFDKILEKGDIMIIQIIDNSVRDEVAKFINKNANNGTMVSKGRRHKIEELPGFVVFEKNKITGIVTYDIEDRACEIISLDSFIENRGLGTKLIEKVTEVAKNVNCNRVWLVTTNDNTRAIGFYQKRGFEMKAFYPNSVSYARELKPEIPKIGLNNIPLKHEIEFEKQI